MITIKRLHSRAELSPLLDEVIDAMTRMIRRTGTHGQNADILLRSLFACVGLPTAYVLVAFDGDKFVGFLYASLLLFGKPFVEVHALWTRPGYATKLRKVVNDLLIEWARKNGAHQIVATVTRSYERFFKFFHEPLGYKVVGYVIELEVE